MSHKNGIKYLAAASLLAISLNFSSANFSYAANAPSVNDAVKALGLEKSTSDFSYATKTIKDGVAIFEKVNMGGDSTADKIIISVSPIDQNLEFQIFGAKIKGTDDLVIADEIQFHSNDKLDFSNSVKLPFSKNGQSFSGDIVFKNVTIKDTERGEDLTAKTFTIKNAKFDGDEFKSFKNMNASDVFVPLDKEADLRIGTIAWDEPSEEMLKDFDSKSNKGMSDKKDMEMISSFAFKKFKMTDMNIKPKNGMLKGKDGSSFIGLNLGNFEINDFSKDKVGSFAFNKFNVDGIYENEPVSFKLDEISFKDLDVKFFETYMAPYFKSKDEKGLAAIRKLKLRDVFVGGPLYNGMSAFNISGMDFSGAGASMKLDKMAFTSTKNAQNIVTSYEMPVGNFTLDVTDSKKPFGMLLSMGLEQMGLDSVKMSFGAKADYDVVNDKANVTQTFFRWEKMGELGFEMSLLNQMKWLETTSIGDLFDATQKSINMSKPKPAPVKAAAPKKTAAKPTGKKGTKTAAKTKAAPTKAQANADARSKDETKAFLDMMQLYKGVRVSHMRFEAKDLGGIDRASVREGFEKNLDAKKVRSNWAMDLTKEANKPTNSPFESKFLNALAKFIGLGGTMFVQFDNPEGLDIVDTINKKTDPNTLGIEFGVKQ